MAKFKMIHHVDQQTIDEMYRAYAPVFILSTGRTGSKFIARLLEQAANVKAFHEPRPTLQYFSNFAFHHQHERQILTRLIDGARMEMILEVFIQDKVYVESNQCLTFFAPELANLFKESRFVHLIRHPGDFTRSAVRKGWHKNDSIWESGRLRMADETTWGNMDQTGRLAWLWDTTNRFISGFIRQLEPHRTSVFRIEDLVSDVEGVRDLLAFVGAEDVPVEKIQKMQEEKINEPVILPNEPPNMQKVPDFPEYGQWPVESRIQLQHYCKELTAAFNYDL